MLFILGILFLGACTPSEAAKEFAEFQRVQQTQAEFMKTLSCEGCDLRQAQLAGAKLSGARLRGAFLKGADLNGADLRGADLREAVLVRVDLSTRALLAGANLIGADLSGANLSQTSLEGVRLCRTTMPDKSVRNDHCKLLGIEVVTR